jgi:TonB family protein
METYLLYILKSSLAITVLCLLYQLIKNDKNFTRNRIFLVCGLLLSFIIPLISFSVPKEVEISGTVLLDPVIIGEKTMNNFVHHNLDILHVFMWIYITGIIILLVRAIFQIFRLIRFAKLKNVNGVKGYKLVLTKDGSSPFSFFNLIFISEQIGKKEAKTILAHEQAHADQWHSLDVLLMEIVVILQWFNPVVWLYRTMLREVHEYLADRKTLNNGFEKAGYLQLLFATAMKVQPADITNSFCQIKLKRRLTMITKKCNSRFSGLKFVFTLSVIVVFVWLASCDFSAKVKDETSTELATSPDSNKNEAAKLPESNENKEVFTVVEQMPEFIGGDEARVKFLSKNIKYPQKAKESGIQGTVYISFIVEENGSVSEVTVLRGIGGGCDEEAMRVVKMMPKWKSGKQSGKNVRVQFNMPIKFQLS